MYIFAKKSMKQFLLFSLIALLFASCGSNPESDNVAYNPKSFEYTFSLNPLFTADSTVKKFNATLYLYSTLPGNTQLTITCLGTTPGKKYRAVIYDEDTSQPAKLSAIPSYAFPELLALDSSEIIYSQDLKWDFDSTIQHFPRYLTILYPDSLGLNDGNILIKGKFGKP